MKPKLIILIVLMILAFITAMVSAFLNWENICIIALVSIDIFAIIFLLDEPEMLKYCSYSQPYIYFP